jgi:N-acetylneuraminate synthase
MSTGAEVHYVVAGCRPWNQKLFDQSIAGYPGKWHFITAREDLTAEKMRATNPRFIFFLHWSWKVPDKIVDGFECVCFHMTDLPYGRGGSPLQNLIVRGHRETKVTALRMSHELDAGPVYLKEPLSLQGRAEDIYIRAGETAAKMIARIIHEEITPSPQTGEAVVFNRRKPEESDAAQLESLSALYDHIRMLDAEDYPHAFLQAGNFRMEFVRAVQHPDRIVAEVSITQVKATASSPRAAKAADAEPLNRPRISTWQTEIKSRKMTAKFQIGQRSIGPGEPVYIIAELSANHGQDFEQAKRIIRAAKAAGADAVKLQTYTPDTMTVQSEQDCFQVRGGTLWDGRTLYELYGEAHTPWEWQPKLKDLATELGLDLFSSAFDSTAVDFLETMNVPVHKVASPELVDIPLIEKMARTGKPLILSTGMATLEEIEEAMRAARAAGATQIALLRCTSSYPASPEEMNLRSIPDLAQRFEVQVGLSDHTPGIAVSVAAVTLGASMIEKHLTLSRAEGGPDAAFSLEPHEFAELVKAVRSAEQSLGRVQYGPTPHERRTLPFRRSLFVVRDIKKGETLTADHVRSIRPANGLHPRHLPEVVGRPAARDIDRGTPVTWELLGSL